MIYVYNHLKIPKSFNKWDPKMIEDIHAASLISQRVVLAFCVILKPNKTLPRFEGGSTSQIAWDLKTTRLIQARKIHIGWFKDSSLMIKPQFWLAKAQFLAG